MTREEQLYPEGHQELFTDAEGDWTFWVLPDGRMFTMSLVRSPEGEVMLAARAEALEDARITPIAVYEISLEGIPPGQLNAKKNEIRSRGNPHVAMKDRHTS